MPKRMTDDEYQAYMDKLLEKVTDALDDAEPEQAALVCAHVVGCAITVMETIAERRKILHMALERISDTSGASISITREEIIPHATKN